MVAVSPGRALGHPNTVEMLYFSTRANSEFNGKMDPISVFVTATEVDEEV